MAVPLERFWRTVNPFTRPLAGYVPWWVLVETTGRHSGVRRRTPLAGAALEGTQLSLLAVYGDSASFVKNIRGNPNVRVKRLGRWHAGTAEIVDATPDGIASLGRYARHVLLRVASDPKIVRVSIG